MAAAIPTTVAALILPDVSLIVFVSDAVILLSEPVGFEVTFDSVGRTTQISSSSSCEV
jgi:hypothetical protein